MRTTDVSYDRFVLGFGTEVADNICTIGTGKALTTTYSSFLLLFCDYIEFY